MKISFIGLGKLGLPTAYAMAYKGHQVLGYDININRYTTELDTIEAGKNGKGTYQELFNENKNTEKNLNFTPDMKTCVLYGDIIFVAIQTPHKREFEGIMPLTENREDFEYKHLVNCIKDISYILEKNNLTKTVSIISTVLPGTIRREIFPVMRNINLCYNPYFIAMGTVIRDFLFPEFILLGSVNKDATNQVIEFYKTITDSPVYKTTLENAEMIKVSYNTFIGTKIALANNIMELCDKLPNTNSDDVMNGLFMATNRLISTNYLRGGMGDGGGCHPRDNIALSWLSNKLDISFNFFDAIMTCREKQTQYLLTLIQKYKTENPDMEVCILGKAFKPNTGICTGSPAVLLKNLCDLNNVDVDLCYDPLVDNKEIDTNVRRIYCLAVKHDNFKNYKFGSGSIVIDPFRYIKNIDDVIIHRIGDSYNRV